jgi:tetratricopeptide (TPR) repeat protein
LRRTLRGDLDNIVLMALRKEPERRYGSVEQLSGDIRRYSEARPVLARTDTVGYRLTKFVRRNRAGVMAGALAGLALIGGVASTVWQSRVARDQQAKAERRFNDVRTLARTVLFDYHDAIKNLPGATPVRERLVKDALEYLDRLAREARGDTTLQRELAAAYERVSDVQGGTLDANLGDTTGAIASARKALELRVDLAASDPSSAPLQRELAASYFKIGSLLWETGGMAEAARNLEKSVTIRKTLADASPGDRDLQYGLGAAYDRLGMLLLEMGDAEGALRRHQEDLAIIEAMPQAEQRRESVRRRLSVAYEHLGSAMLHLNRLDAALDNNRRALVLRAALAADFPKNADYSRTLLVSYYNDGEILARMGRKREAMASYRKDLEIAERLAASDPRNEQYRGDIAYVLIRVGDMLVGLRDSAGALAHYRRSRDLRAGDVKADPANLWKRASWIEANAKVCRTLADSKDAAAAVACAETAALLRATSVDPVNAQIRSFFAETYFDLAQAAERTKQSGAATLYRASLAIWEDLARRNILSKIDQGKAEAVRKELAALR